MPWPPEGIQFSNACSFMARSAWRCMCVVSILSRPTTVQWWRYLRQPGVDAWWWCVVRHAKFFMVARLGHVVTARWMACFKRSSTPLRERGLPRALGNAIPEAGSSSSRNQAFKTCAVSGHNGTVRSLRLWSAKNPYLRPNCCSRNSVG